MRATARHRVTTATVGVVLWVVLWVFAAVAGCDRWPSDGTTYKVGHGIVVWHPVPERGGFLPWAFHVTTPEGGAPYVVLERVGSASGGRVGSGAEVLAEAPLPAGATRVPVGLAFEHGQTVLRAARTATVVVAGPRPLCCGADRFAASPRDLPQDSAGAIVLQYAISERLAASESGSFATARRLEGASYLRLRFDVRP